MSFNRNPAVYFDVAKVLDAALKAGGGRYELASRGAAFHWRARAYFYRKLLSSITPGLITPTPYDQLALYIGAEGTDEENSVIIKFKEPQGVLKDLDGNPISLAGRTEDPLFDEVQQLLKELGDD